MAIKKPLSHFKLLKFHVDKYKSAGYDRVIKKERRKIQMKNSRNLNGNAYFYFGYLGYFYSAGFFCCQETS